MNPKIDPLILQKLQAFNRRRRQLILRRGIYAAVTTLLAGMMIVALIDWLFVVPDAVRWGLSAAAYLAIIIVEWCSCLRLLVSAPGSRRLARLLEHAEPKLREDLLSAVELGEASPEAVFDSEQFRALVQSDVASRMESLDMERLLPAQLLRRHAIMAAGIGVACLVAFALNGFQFGTLMMRALLPMANFARVSKVQVTIVEPAPAELRVPQGDTLPLIIELSGQRASKALLETVTPSGGREVLPMSPLGNDRFSATIQVGRENVLYRVRAGDALTKKYQIEAVARPAVVEFRKSYRYPDYSKLETKTVTEENGDLAALEGSEVEVRMQTNQKVRGAELRIEQGKKTAVVPLTVEGHALVAKVPLNASGIYRVHLVGAESGFENKFSPEYELRAEPDLIPQVELELPKQDLILPSNEIVEVVGTASDDFALSKVSQCTKINEGGWKETPLPIKAGANSKVERRWDLFEQGVKPGDLVTTKLVATDLKGNKAESRPLQVTITSAGFEAKRLQALAGQQRLYEALKAQQLLAAALVKQTIEAQQQFDRLPESDPQRQQVLLPVAPAQQQFAVKAGELMAQIRETLAETATGHQSADLALIGKSLVRNQALTMQNAQRLVDAVSANAGVNGMRELLNEAVDLTTRCDQKARQTVDVHRVLLTAEELDVFSENIHVVSQEQARLVSLAHRSGTEVEKWTPVANRLRVVLAELRGLEELAAKTIDHDAGGVADPLRNVQKLLNKRRTALETALTAKPGAELLSPTLELADAIAETSRLVLEVRRGFRNPPVDRARDLSRDTGAMYANFELLRQEMERVFRNGRIPVEVGDALLAGRWQGTLAVFRGFGDIEEWRADADATFVNDLRLTTRVLEALHENNPGKPGNEFARELLSIDRSFRVLETGHDIAAVVEGLRRLASAERWEIYNPKSRTTNVRDWNWLSERLLALPEELSRSLNFDERSALMQEALKILAGGQQWPAAQTLRGEMEERYNAAHEPVSGRGEAAALADHLQAALDLFREPMAEARKELGKLTPTLAETMKQLAKKTEELKGQTTNQAQQAHEKLPDEARADARQALAEQQMLNEKIEALKDALRADANQQNIMQADGRDRARDADDALAMLKEPPVRAEEDLALAAKTDKAAVQEQALNQAAEQQQKLTNALEKMAEHYAALEHGKPEETRRAMRETEKESGLKEQLDEQAAKAADFAAMAQKTPEELLAQLEKALPQNPQMQQELSAISQNTLKAATDQLKQASAQENAVAQNVQKLAADEKALAAITPTTSAVPAAPNTANPRAPSAVQPSPLSGQPANPMLAQSAQQQKPIGEAAGQAASDVLRAGRHEERMQNKIAGEQLQQMGNALQQTAEKQVPNAQQALQQAQQAAQAQPAVNTANSILQKVLGDLMAASNPAAPMAAESAPPASPPAAPNSTTSAAEQKSATANAPSASSVSSGEAKAQPPTPNAQPGAPSRAASGLAGDAPKNNPTNPAAQPGQPVPTGTPGEMAALPSSPQEQVWMARVLDALDAALNASGSAAQAPGSTEQPGDQPQQGAQASGNHSQAQQSSAAQAEGNKSAPQSNSMEQTQSALAAAAQAAAAQARAERTAEAGQPGQPGQPQPGSMQAISRAGAQSSEGVGSRGALADAKNKAGDWGKLPKQMAEQLSQGQREGIAGEYRNQVETYYRAIAEKSKKQ